MTELWLVRHGQTDWNIVERYQGQRDVPLNEHGLAQARALAVELKDATFSAIYASDLQRASKTAQIVAEQLGMSVRQDPRLREIKQGEWEGKYYSEVHGTFLEKGVDLCPPGGESVQSLAARVAEAADAIAEAQGDGPVLVVMHGLALATLLCAAQNRPLSNAFSLIPGNTRVQVVEWQRGMRAAPEA
ncbi:MAG: histidine phosphatase family protein [Anaerolineaceae bacterium]|nr:histidine phosphatase family protein [Anaerolineaceae bacterium]